MLYFKDFDCKREKTDKFPFFIEQIFKEKLHFCAVFPTYDKSTNLSAIS